MGSLEWSLFQYDWCSYKKRRLEHRPQTGMTNHVSAEQEGNQLTSPGEKPQKKPNLVTLSSQTSSLHNYKKISFSFLI